MSCSNCGDGTPNGCKNNGTCSSGGCNKLEVFDWLANVALPNGQAPYDIVEVRFKNSRKSFFKNINNLSLQPGDVVIVEGGPGTDTGVVSVTGELARIQVKKKAPNFKASDAKKIKSIATQDDIDRWIKSRSLEKEVMYRSRVLAVNLKLQMKISDVEYQGDLSKATFYYTAEGRVDFRQLIRDLAGEFKVRVEMKQIGSRQEAARLGGIGSCGRELCCSTWLTDFRSVSTSAARYQQLSLNPQKLAGQCGKLKCCLNYELDMYLDALKGFPKGDLKLRTEKGTAFHVKTDVFKKEMWYAYDDGKGSGSSLVALKPERVREIIRQNKDGKKPYDLSDFIDLPEVVTPDYTNVVGQDDLNRFEHIFKKNKKRPNKRKGNNSNPNNKGNTNPNQKKKPNPNQKKGNNSNPNNKGNRNPNQKKKPNPNQKKGNNRNPNSKGNTSPNQKQAQGDTVKNPPKKNNNNNRRKKPGTPKDEKPS